MTYKTENPQPADFGLVRISGATGLAIDVAQRLIGSGSYFTHAFIVADETTVIQAQPGGVARVPLSEVVGSGRVVYSDFDLSWEQRTRIVDAARCMISTDYSFADYPAIGAARLLHWNWLENFVSDDGHLICSQLVDEAYGLAGIELFPNRIAGDVVPGDLAKLIGAN